ncbi:MAG: hypothetical protein JWM11_5963 [Planctomycetaceae bacterium]|nr:hypothetical protein [Planctomycetaceae bacterium]
MHLPEMTLRQELSARPISNSLFPQLRTLRRLNPIETDSLDRRYFAVKRTVSAIETQGLSTTFVSNFTPSFRIRGTIRFR